MFLILNTIFIDKWEISIFVFDGLVIDKRVFLLPKQTEYELIFLDALLGLSYVERDLLVLHLMFLENGLHLLQLGFNLVLFSIYFKRTFAVYWSCRVQGRSSLWNSGPGSTTSFSARWWGCSGCRRPWDRWCISRWFILSCLFIIPG